MARPKKVNTEIMGDDMVEVKQDVALEDVQQASQDVEIASATFIEDKVPALEVEIVKPKVQEVKEKIPTPICDIDELSESDKAVLIEKRIKAILDQTQIPYIPAMVRFKEPDTTAVPPMYALVDYDHRFVNEGWDFYRTNVKNPYLKDYLELVRKLGKPNRIITRLVFFDYE